VGYTNVAVNASVDQFLPQSEKFGTERLNERWARSYYPGLLAVSP